MKARKRRTRYMTVIWRGIKSVPSRIYLGTSRRELFLPDIRGDSPWVGAMSFAITFKGRHRYRGRTASQKPRHARRMGIA